MGKFISDEDFAKIDTAPAKAVLSDDEMNKLEDSHKASKTEAALRGGAQGVTAGFADELVGAGKGIYDDMKSLVTGDRKGPDATFDENGKVTNADKLDQGNYKQYRDEYRAGDTKAEADHPNIYGGSKLASGVAASVLTGGGSGIAGQAARAGIEGVTRSLGDSKELDPEAVKDALKSGTMDAATAGALAKIMPGLVSKAGEYGTKGAEWLDSVANRRLVKSLGGSQGQTQKLGDKVNDIGNMLYENKIVTPLASSKTIAENLGKQSDKIAQDMAPIYKESAGARISTDDLEQVIRDRASELSSKAGTVPQAGQVSKYADNVATAGRKSNAQVLDHLEQGGDLSDALANIEGSSYNPSDLKAFRKSVQDGVNFNTDAVSQQGAKDVRNLLREKEMGLIESVDPSLRSQNEKLFRDYHLNSLAEDMAEKGAAKSASNNDIGLPTYLAGATAASAKGGPAAVVAMALREFGRRYGDQMGGIALKNVAKAAQSPKFSAIFEQAAKDGPTAVAAVHEALKNNADYQAELNK